MCGTEHFLQGRYSGTNKTSRHRKGSILIGSYLENVLRAILLRLLQPLLAMGSGTIGVPYPQL